MMHDGRAKWTDDWLIKAPRTIHADLAPALSCYTGTGHDGARGSGTRPC